MPRRHERNRLGGFARKNPQPTYAVGNGPPSGSGSWRNLPPREHRPPPQQRNAARQQHIRKRGLVTRKRRNKRRRTAHTKEIKEGGASRGSPAVGRIATTRNRTPGHITRRRMMTNYDKQKNMDTARQHQDCSTAQKAQANFSVFHSRARYLGTLRRRRRRTRQGQFTSAAAAVARRRQSATAL